MIHELKCWPVYFQAVWDGVKRFEVRHADRPYQAGDQLKLRECLPRTSKKAPGKRYTGRYMLANVTYLLAGPAMGLPASVCVLSIEVLELGQEMYQKLERSEADG